jgi:multimeric flavodoxin WrbA
LWKQLAEALTRLSVEGWMRKNDISSYGHIETMAAAVAEGARETGARVDIKRVPELDPDKVNSVGTRPAIQ